MEIAKWYVTHENEKDRLWMGYFSVCEKIRCLLAKDHVSAESLCTKFGRFGGQN